MSLLKRSGNSDILSPLPKHQKNSSSQVSMFIILPNQIIITVFEYLKPREIIFSFSNLNRQFTSLVQKYKQNVNLCDLTDKCIEQVLLLIREDVVSLKVDHFIFFDGENGDLFQQFPSLQQLSISKINLPFSKQLLPFARSFKRLTKLELKCRHDIYIFPGTKLIHDELLPHIFQRDCSVENCSIVPISKLSDDTIALFSSCNLTKLEVHLTAGRDLFILFGYLPQIQIFKCKMSYFILTEDMSAPTVNTPYLREFSLENTDYTTEFTVIASFLKQRPSIERLSLNMKLTRESQYLDGNRLRQEFLQDLVHLKLFQFNFYIDYSRDHQLVNMANVISTFQTDFWLKDHDWKVGGRSYKYSYYSGCCLFSLPYAFPHFRPALMSSNFSHLKTTTSLSSNLFHKVQSIDIEIDQTDKTLSILKFVETYFKRITYLSLYNASQDHRLMLPPTELTDLCLPTVKILKFHDQYYDWKHYEDLKQLFSIFPNLTELLINRYDLENAGSYLYEHGGDKDLLQLKHLHTFTVETDNTYQGSNELDEIANDFKKRFRKRLPGRVLRWISPYGEEGADNDDISEEEETDGSGNEEESHEEDEGEDEDGDDEEDCI